MTKVQAIRFTVVAVAVLFLSLTAIQFSQNAAASSEPVYNAAATWNSCVPVEVMVYDSRIHVRCASSIAGGIFYFAYPTTDASKTARLLSVLTSAQVAGRTLTILSDLADTSGTSFGCQANDCRKIQAAGFGR